MRLQIADCRLQIGVRFGLQIGLQVMMALASTLTIVHADEIIDRVMAVVAGDLIMLSDVRGARELGLIDPGTATDPDREVLTRLIDRALVLAEVDRYAPPEPGAAAVDAQLAALRSRFGSADALTAALARLGLDENYLRQQLREDLRIRAYLDQRFASDVPERRRLAIDEWVAGLRRRADVIDSYVSNPAPTLTK
jgi:hypothetical protein